MSKQRNLVIIAPLVLFLTERLAEESFGVRSNVFGSLLRLQFSAAWYMAYPMSIFSLVFFTLAYHVWHKLELPYSGTLPGQRIHFWLVSSIFASIILVSILACCGGSVVRFVWLVYLLVAVAIWSVQRALRSHLLMRTMKITSAFWPTLFWRVALERWIRHASLSKEQAALAIEEFDSVTAKRAVDAAMDLGGIFVKFGQFLSLFCHLIGLAPVFARELQRLQSDVLPLRSAEARSIVAAELGRPLEEVFECFEDVPLGAASLGQVHRARLAASGLDVAVKIQYPTVAQSLRSDVGWVFLMLKCLLRLVEGKPSRAALDALDSFRDALGTELDYLAEARTLQRLHASHRAAFPSVVVPAAVAELCTPRLLVMGYVPGTSVMHAMSRSLEALAEMAGETTDDAYRRARKAARSNVYRAPAGASEQQPEDPADAAAAQPGGTDQGPSGGAVQQRTSPLKKLLGTVWALLPKLSQATKLRLLLRFMSMRNAFLNVGIAAYNRTVSLVQAPLWKCKPTIPTFDPAKMSYLIWRVQGHQLLVEGLFNSDPHPGNFLIDDRTGRLGLIDFGQVCEVSLETRVRLARLIAALSAGVRADIARQAAQCGFRSRRMCSEQLELHARRKFGHIAKSGEFSKRVKKFDQADPMLPQTFDSRMPLITKMISQLRGTNVFLGVMGKHSPQTVWLDFAQALIRDHGAHVPEVRVDLDLDI